MNTRLAALALLATGLLAGCSGDSVNPVIPEPTDPGGPGPLPPPQGSSHYLGPYSIWGMPAVGAVEVDYRGCDGAQVVVSRLCIDLLVDGEAVILNAIDRGTIVEVSLFDPLSGGGRFLDVQHAVVGPVQSVDWAVARFTVLGQTVSVTDNTLGFGESTTSGLADHRDLNVGDYVTVSGYFSAGGQILASRVDRNAGPGPLLLRGVLAQAADGGFRIGDVNLDLAIASLENFPGGTPLPGNTVLLFADQAPQGNVLTVHTARYSTSTFQHAAASYIKGFVTDVRSNWDFDIGGRTVRTDDCEDCADLDAAGTRLRAGTFVEFGKTATGDNYFGPARSTSLNTGLTGPIDAVNSADGSLSVLGIGVQISPATIMTTEADPWLGSVGIALADLAAGSTVALRGGVFDGQVVADYLTTEASGTRISGSTYDLEEPFIRFLGRSIRTDALTSVLDCDIMGDNCYASDVVWLFANALRLKAGLLVEIEAVGSELRAASVAAYSYQD